jgi:protein associated with RNAse G/E
MFTAAPGKREIYCDICMPPTWTSAAEVTVVDLDLDLARFRPDGRVILEDEDEFAANAQTYGYPAGVVARATDAAAEVHAALTGRTEPFDAAARPWLDLLAAR